MRFAVLTLPLLALVAACHKAPPPPATDVGPIPASVCAQVKKSLDQLKSAGGIEITDKAEATVEQEIWLAMNDDQRGGFANALAFRAACASGHQSDDQEVTIRAEDGSLLMHRIVSTRMNLQDALGRGEDVAR